MGARVKSATLVGLTTVLLAVLGVCAPAAGELRLALSAGKASFQEGETLTLFLAAQNQGASVSGDFYLVMLDPRGRVYSLGASGWQAGLQPWFRNITLPAPFDLPAIPLPPLLLPSKSPPISGAGTYFFAAAVTDGSLQPQGPLALLALDYYDLTFFVGSWNMTPRYIGDFSTGITYSFALPNGQPRFTMGGRVWGVGIQLVFGRYALGPSGLLTYTLESECLQYPEGGWYLCDDPYIRPFARPEIHSVRYAVARFDKLGFEILKTGADQPLAQQGWYARGPDLTADASAVGRLAGMWRCLGCTFPNYHQLLIYRAGKYRFHWVDDVADITQGLYYGLRYFVGDAQVAGSSLRLQPDVLYECPDTVYQSNVEKFFVEPGLLTQCRVTALKDVTWEIPFVARYAADGSAQMQLTLQGGVLTLTRQKP